MTPFELHCGDCVEVMAAMDEASVDAICTDPPYGLEFMNAKWDRLGDIGQAKHQGFSDGDFKGFRLASGNAKPNLKCRKCRKWQYDYPERKCVCKAPDLPNWRAHQSHTMQQWHHAWAVEALRVLKPGGHLLAFGGTRTVHRLTCALEDAGFEIRDSCIWIYGSGFPKSLDVSKAIDRAAGAEREVVGYKPIAYPDSDCWGIPNANSDGAFDGSLYELGLKGNSRGGTRPTTAPATPEAKQWQGWGTALKPSHEPIVMARKPLVGNVAANVLEHGTGALNIDGCRIAHDEECRMMDAQKNGLHNEKVMQAGRHEPVLELKPSGRWPANVMHDGSPEVVALFPQTESGDIKPYRRLYSKQGGFKSGVDLDTSNHKGDSGSAARYFYVPKADKTDRDEGLEGTARQEPFKAGSGMLNENGVDKWQSTFRYNQHPTVKPTDLMRYLVRLITPPGGVVLDPFMGSGSTGKAVVQENLSLLAQGQEPFRFIGIEKDAEYCEIARRRIAAVPQSLFDSPG